MLDLENLEKDLTALKYKGALRPASVQSVTTHSSFSFHCEQITHLFHDKLYFLNDLILAVVQCIVWF